MINERPPRLDLYRKKRDPERTPEPFGGRPAGGPPRFVVQQHAARRLHYDLRLEMDGVLKSWAVPEGPSVRPEVRRLAVHVEDHPVEYADFEGVIPKDNYGAGSVIVWDHGPYRLTKPGDGLQALERGKLEFELFGQKLRGRFTLVRMARKDKEWLLLKKAGPGSGETEATARYPRSVLSGLTVDEMRDLPGWRAALHARLQALGAPRRPVPARGQPFMLAVLGERPFDDPAWLAEVKYDGVRVLARRAGDTVELLGRSGQVVTARYPEVAAALERLPAEQFVLDGELVALDEAGKPSFQRLQARMGLHAPGDVTRARTVAPVTGVFFDCLALEGHDLRELPLSERKACLARLLPPLGVVRYGDHVTGTITALFELAAAERLEGIVAKRAASHYVGGRSREWVKLKCQKRQEFVIGGYTDPQGSRGHLGALHLGLYEGSRLVYVSKVGSGFDHAALEALRRALEPLARDRSPFDARTPGGRGHHWVEPRLVCEVRFTEWTEEGGLRHPTYLGLRPDRRPEDCHREAPVALPPAPLEAPAPEAAPREVRITNATKVFWPDERYTKGDLIAYYEAVAPHLLPYLRDRPIVLTRYPDGIAGKSFFQKDAPDFVPSWVRTERLYSRDADREIDYFVVDDVETLRYVVNLGTIPLHVWSARLPSLDRPDWLVLDLDPKGAPFANVVTVARTLRRLLGGLGVPSYAKTSGATGLHVLAPLAARYSHDQARAFARLVALLAVEAHPDIATVARPLHARGGKVYVDFGQNGHGRTIVAPFAVRALPGAPASCPLDWREVTVGLDPRRFSIRTIPVRFARRRDPLAPVLGTGIDLLAALARLEARVRKPR